MVNSDNLAFVEQLYSQFREDPDSLDAPWREFFSGWNGAPQGPGFSARSIFDPGGAPAATADGVADALKQERVDQLIRAYRVRGHRIAALNPLSEEQPSFPELELGHYGLTEADLKLKFSALCMGLGVIPLEEILGILRSTYCRSIGVQYMHIDDPEPKFWLQEKMESTQNQRALSRDQQLRILTRLTDASMFEEFLAKKYVGAKRFGLEGGESLIPLLDLALEQAGEHGVQDIVMGMAHRGRLNVMANIMQKSPALVFREFDDADPEQHFGRGDVKYHLGLSNQWVTEAGKTINLTLCFNPSHLEFVGPVVLGRVRSRQDRMTHNFTRCMGLIIHGDAAFAGQGVVQEMLNMSEIPGFRTGGTLHVILNNQIGFTTGPGQARSSHYCTDVAKMLQIPIFHVNGEHPEAVAQAVWLAMQFRHEFNRDVVIDMYCYRKHGHNEGDDPTYTQPVMYREISKRQSVRDGYLDNLAQLGEVTREEAEEIALARREHLERELEKARSPEFDYTSQSGGSRGLWSRYRGGPDADTPQVKTAIDKETAVGLLEAMTRLPSDFHPHPKIEKLILAGRAEMAAGEKPLDWGTAELLAYASLLAEGTPVRLTGQDVGRGTFSHRHAALYDYKTGKLHLQLNHLKEGQARMQVWNSPLTETAVLGYEFGFSLDSPDNLVVWEAQFGDFCNVAQVIVDQFIATSEDKWKKLNHLVMLLPHGFEGQGPEHSSARLERYLQIAAEDNICVANLTTPAQFFHLLRRQIVRPIRKPLIVMSPKSLLRHPDCVSPLEDFYKGAFRQVMADSSGIDRSQVTRVLMCSGKIYYELDRYRQEHSREDVAILRLEQLYPFPTDPLRMALGAYSKGVPLVWVQEEPENMGALNYLRLEVPEQLLG
ncbi:MAG: 2-oxoglutarate dehydrogenase E1 component, partial [Candidatus Eremiobacteraeota bacterium]|nr:2-oxoglutarate dehydrogenase E1 component [Candidatus Eremiobacteraeota bacterium]